MTPFPRVPIVPADEDWMRTALELAQRAEEAGEVPVGAVLVRGDERIGQGWNRPIGSHDPTAHAEIVALREAGRRMANYRLVETTLYVTLEPCIMCVGAIMHARIKRLVFGAPDARCGAVASAVHLADADFLNHALQYTGGVLEESCSALLRRFFRQKR